MRHLMLVIFLLAHLPVLAEPKVSGSDDQGDMETVLLESYIHYFTIREAFQRCTMIVPHEANMYSKVFADWENRNRDEIQLVNQAFTKYFASREKEMKELTDAAPLIAHEQNQATNYDQISCKGLVLATDVVHLMDYSIKLQEQLETLGKAFPGLSK